jgi:hypothetical protein
MTLNLLPMRPEQRRRLKAGWLFVACLGSVYLCLEPLNHAREIASQRQTGLGAVAGGGDLTSLWRQSNILGDKSSGIAQSQYRAYRAIPQQAAMFQLGAGSSEAKTLDRKLVRNDSLQLIVKSPVDAAESARQIAEASGGYLVSSQISGAAEAATASVSIRVPVDHFEEVRSALRKLAVRIDSDSLDAQDVTKEYVDREARLRNLEAQEQQYLSTMKRAATVKDTLEVSDKLNEIRGQIEQQRAEFDTLSRQIETVAISVRLYSDAEDQVLGIHWHPLYRVKLAMRDGLSGLSEYLASMTTFAFLLPTILLWLMTLVAGAAIAWRFLGWAISTFFRSPNPNKVVS